MKWNPWGRCRVAIFAALSVACGSAADRIDLAGEWKFAADRSDSGATATAAQWQFPDRIRLPGTVADQGFGEPPNIKTPWTGEGWRYPEMFKEWQGDDDFKFPFFLQPPRHYLGPAWYQRDIEIPADWEGMEVLVFFERVHWQSRLWVDGKAVGESSSLGTPHEFDLGMLAPGKHTITLRVDNRLIAVNPGPLSHSVTDHTQGNWNGVVGKMELRRSNTSRITNLQIHPSMDGSFRIHVTGKVDPNVHEAGIQIHIEGGVGSGESLFLKNEVVQRSADGTFEIHRSGKLDSARLWNEFQPALYTASAMLNCGDDMPSDMRRIRFGFREVGTQRGRITINGRKSFLRGTLECCIFPLTGYPPTDVESWKRIVGICKAHGLNHIRFHSWCPPEAAFVAADELGFYYQVEVSSWANQGAQIGSGLPLDEWIERESKRMLEVYGNHPSFVLMAYGNEPAGRNHAKWLQQWVARRKVEDPRRLYTTGAGWTIMPGSDFHSSPKPRIQQWGEGMKSIINQQAPRTDFDWSAHVMAQPDAPLISHEIGQWCVYPNYREIGKYTGHFKARNFEIFRKTAEQSGILHQSDDFLRSSGKLQVIAYKHDIEAALRTPEFGGFQLLDLHDFPGQGTALVGVLDAFWDEKGYVSPEEYRRFCGPVVPLARMEKMVFSNQEVLHADVELAHFGQEDFKNIEVMWRLIGEDGKRVAEGGFPKRDMPSGDLHALGSIQVKLDSLNDATRLKLEIDCPEKDFGNSWDVFVFPDEPPLGFGKVVFATDLAQVKQELGQGRSVLWCPPSAKIADDPKRPLVAGFSPIFWNTAWTEWQPPHTLGILCDPSHPSLAGFPTEMHSNWQWWEIQKDSRPFILTGMKELTPLVQVVDDWFTNRKLGYLFEAKVGKGRLMASSVDLGPMADRRIGVSQLKRSVVTYMESDQFNPKVEVEVKALEELVHP